MKKSGILYSIICPFYNSEKFLKEAIESVKFQTYKNWELILVDDGSNDRSVSIAEMQAKKDPRIKIFSILNSGTYAARNFGIGKSTGSFIIFLDSDDYLDKQTLEVINSELEKENFDIILFNIESFGPNNIHKKQPLKILKRESVVGATNIVQSTFVDHEYGYGVCGCCFKKSLFSKINYCAPDGLKSAEDIFLAYLLFSNSSKILFLPVTFYHYRMNELSTTHSMTLKDYIDCCDVFIFVYSDIYKKYHNVIPLKENKKIIWGCFSFIIHEPKIGSRNVFIKQCKKLRKSLYYKNFINKMKYPSKSIMIIKTLINFRLFSLAYFLIKFVFKN